MTKSVFGCVYTVVALSLLGVVGCYAKVEVSDSSAEKAIAIDWVEPPCAEPGSAAGYIEGNGFGAENVTITVGGIEAEVLTATGMDASFVVPEELAPGPTEVVVTNPGGRIATINWVVCGFDCSAIDCDDGNECTIDTCDPAVEECVYTLVGDGAVCDFGGLPGICVAGVCQEDASCPVLTNVLATPPQANVGDEINVSAEASGVGPIDYLWTASGGSFVDPSLPITAYRCEVPGQQDLTITISDGTGSCTDDRTVTVTCLGSPEPCSTEDLDANGIPDVCPPGYNYIEGTAGADTIVGTTGSDCIFGLGGNDDIVGGDELDYICAGDGADIVDGESGDDRIYGEGGDDTINGSDGSDYINGAAGDDTLTGNADNDTLDGGIGTDNLFGNSGLDACLNAANMDVTCETFTGHWCTTLPNGFPCSGGGVCIDGLCDLGNVCIYEPVDCGASSECLTDGWCDALCDPIDAGNGLCDRCTGQDSPIPDGTLCSGGICIDGLCSVGFCADQPVDCSASSECLTDGICDPVCDPIDAANGLCDRCVGQDNPVPDGTLCSGGACFDGVCDADPCSTEDSDTNGVPDVCPLGYNYIEGTAGPDTIVGTTGPDCIFGLGGNDDIVGGDGMDYICAGEGADIVNGESGDDRIYGEGDDDTINGGDGGDYINGAHGDDTLSGNGGNDRLDGGIGTDNIFGNSGSDVCLNAANVDPSCENFVDSFCLSYPNGFPCSGGSVCIDGVCGLNDFFCINQPVDCSASDECLTNGWCDPVCDPIDAANGLCDRCAGQDNPVPDGSPCGSGGTCFAGVCDTDLCSTEDLDANGTPDVCPLGYNYIEGTAGPDTIVGTSGPDCIFGLGGNDDIVGGDGMDYICAGEGADIVDGESGDDQIYGAGGDDTINGGDGGDRLSGADGADTLNGGAGNDTANGGAGVDFINGGPENDTLDGGDSNDIINGNDGDDTISGGPGDDTLDGNAGTDNLFGNSGTDLCLNAANMDPSCEAFVVN